MKVFSKFMTLAGVLALAAFTATGATAAPQALGLVATYGDVELKCDGDACTADFTAFCLQQDRKSPARGTAYFLANGDIRVAGTTASGETVELNARAALKIESRRQHLAVRLSVPQEIVDAQGLQSVAVDVKRGVVLLPETGSNDADPHTQQEVAMLSEYMRSVGTSVVDTNTQLMASARILGDVINGLPERGKADDLFRQQLWDDAIGRRGTQTPADAVDRARGIYKLCRWTAGRGTPNMRHCLEGHHDGLMKFLNGEYWKAAKPTM